ncbi:MAG: TRAP transporter small permease [Alcaligenaceae bacterium]|nr:TRAP transporter small permease [Alcaligenaceae bacterium]
MQLTQSYIHVVEKINRIIFFTIAIFLAALALILFVQVVLRYIWHSPLIWSEEVAKYLSIWVVFLGMGIAMRNMSLIAVEAVIQAVSDHIRYRIRSLVLLLVAIFMAYLVYIGIIITTEASDQNFASMEISMSVAYAAMPVGAFLTLLNVLVVFIELTKKDNKTWD